MEIENETQKIEMDFTYALELSGQLQLIAEKLSDTVEQELKKVFLLLKQSWESENADLFLLKGNDLAEQMRDLHLLLQETAGDIRESAKKMYEAEQISLYYAQTRKYR